MPIQGGLGVVIKGKEVVLLSQLKKNNKPLAIAKSKDGSVFVLVKRALKIKNKNKNEAIKNCSDFRLHKDERGDFLLDYKSVVRRKASYLRAVSKTLSAWTVKQTSCSAFEPESILADYSFKRQKVKYYGKGSVYVSFYKTLKKKSFWENSSTPVLEPRCGHFDDTALEIGQASAIKEGLLLSYYIKYDREGRSAYALGAALFDKKNPARLLWRSSHPIWEQPEDWDKKNLRAVGVAHLNGQVCMYLEARNGEIISVCWSFKNNLLPLMKGRLVPEKLAKYPANPIIKPEPKSWWESKAVMNAAALYENGRVHMLYRAIGDTDISVIGYASSADGMNFDERLKHPIYVPREKFEGVGDIPFGASPYLSGGGGSGGCEDPRIARVGDMLYMTYVAFDGYHGPRMAMTSIKITDFLNRQWAWSKPKIISKNGQTSKNWVLFPDKINGKFAILHSIAPKVMIDYFDSLDGDIVIDSHRHTNTNENRWDNIVRGAGAPPIMTKYGWLLFYHAMDRNDPNKYKVGAMILDKKNPRKVLYRSTQPILEPVEKYENEGFKAGVVFVCGASIIGDDLFVYYGGADTVMCVATAKLDKFLEQLVTREKVRVAAIKIKK